MGFALADLQREAQRLVERGLNAGLEPGEIADTLQAEIDELEVTAGDSVKSGVIQAAGYQ